MAFQLKRWRLAKYSLMNGEEVGITAPEARRLYWTAKGAVRERNRLNHILMTSHFPTRYKAVRR